MNRGRGGLEDGWLERIGVFSPFEEVKDDPRRSGVGWPQKHFWWGVIPMFLFVLIILTYPVVSLFWREDSDPRHK